MLLRLQTSKQGRALHRRPATAPVALQTRGWRSGDAGMKIGRQERSRKYKRHDAVQAGLISCPSLVLLHCRFSFVSVPEKTVKRQIHMVDRM